MKTKTVRDYVDMGCGFPVVIDEVPMLVKPWGEIPLIQSKALEEQVLLGLAQKPARLIGHEVKFIRKAMGLTLQAFADRVGKCHSAVINWEKAGDRSTKMEWSTEKDIRMGILFELDVSTALLQDTYRKLSLGEFPRSEDGERLRVHGERVSLLAVSSFNPASVTHISKRPVSPPPRRVYSKEEFSSSAVGDFDVKHSAYAA